VKLLDLFRPPSLVATLQVLHETRQSLQELLEVQELKGCP
jgi:hypothetical protein